MKATEGGNTGWVVSYGDTGWRNIATSGAISGFTVASARIRRVNNTVTLSVNVGRDDGATGGADALTLPAGFYAHTAMYGSSYYQKPFYVSWDKLHPSSYISGGSQDYFSMTYITDDAWPTVMPGVAL